LTRSVKGVYVRESGGVRELRVDGTLASTLRAGQVSTGSVWDAIVAPALALAPGSLRSALILGLGAGSAARLLRALAPGAHIVGVEQDARVIAAARRHFDLDALGLELVVTDALSALRRDRRRFDVVIEDVFVGTSQHLRKPEGFPAPGLMLAWRRVALGGVLISNTIHEGPAVARTLTALGAPAGVCVNVRDYHNRIMAVGPVAVRALPLRAALASAPLFERARPRLALRTLF